MRPSLSPLQLHHGEIMILDKAKNILKKTSTDNLRDAFFALVSKEEK